MGGFIHLPLADDHATQILRAAVTSLLVGGAYVTCPATPQDSKILPRSSLRVSLAVLPAVKRSEEPRPPSLPIGCCAIVVFQSSIGRPTDVRCFALLSRPFRRLAGPPTPGGHRWALALLQCLYSCILPRMLSKFEFYHLQNQISQSTSWPTHRRFPSAGRALLLPVQSLYRVSTPGHFSLFELNNADETMATCLEVVMCTRLVSDCTKHYPLTNQALIRHRSTVRLRTGDGSSVGVWTGRISEPRDQTHASLFLGRYMANLFIISETATEPARRQ